MTKKQIKVKKRLKELILDYTLLIMHKHKIPVIFTNNWTTAPLPRNHVHSYKDIFSGHGKCCFVYSKAGEMLPTAIYVYMENVENLSVDELSYMLYTLIHEFAHAESYKYSLFAINFDAEVKAAPIIKSMIDILPQYIAKYVLKIVKAHLDLSTKTGKESYKRQAEHILGLQ